MKLLAGDVGGTKTYLALYEGDAEGRFNEVKSFVRGGLKDLSIDISFDGEIKLQ